MTTRSYKAQLRREASDRRNRVSPFRETQLNNLILREGDMVHYVGERFKSELAPNGKPCMGWIHARVEDNPRAFVVEFNTKSGDSYVMDVSVLAKWVPSKSEKENGPDVQPRRRKSEDE